jgi:flagellar protein FliL
MSESTEAAPAADAAAPAPKASKLPLILAAVNFVAILGLGGYFVYTQQHAAAQAKKADEKADEKKEGEHGEEKAAAHGEEGEEEAEQEPEEAEEAAEGHGEKKAAHGEEKASGHGEKKAGHGEEAAGSDEHQGGGPLLELASMVTNLAEPDNDRYLKVTIQVRITGEAARAEVEAQIVPVRNQILLYLSSLTVADTSGAENKRDIQKKVKRIANEAMPSSRITQVYFTEFVIQ